MKWPTLPTAALALAAGQPVYAQVKGVALLD